MMQFIFLSICLYFVQHMWVHWMRFCIHTDTRARVLLPTDSRTHTYTYARVVCLAILYLIYASNRLLTCTDHTHHKSNTCAHIAPRDHKTLHHQVANEISNDNTHTSTDVLVKRGCIRNAVFFFWNFFFVFWRFVAPSQLFSEFVSEFIPWLVPVCVRHLI
jgi:hypothetical protein